MMATKTTRRLVATRCFFNGKEATRYASSERLGGHEVDLQAPDENNDYWTAWVWSTRVEE